MGPAIREVLHDLWCFALRRDSLEQPVVVQPPFVAKSASEEADEVESKPATTLDSGRMAYVIQSDAPCFVRPVLAFDTRIGTLSYGEAVFVEVTEAGFARVRTAEVSGWVAQESLSNERADVEPGFVADVTYAADHLEARKLRAYLGDALDGGSLQLPVQPTEYVLYRLQSRGINLDWPAERPRLPGNWQHLLRGNTRVRMGVEPKTNAVLECGGSDITPRLGMVEAVAPDGTITITQFDSQSPGTFRQASLANAAWRELRPIFISFV